MDCIDFNTKNYLATFNLDFIIEELIVYFTIDIINEYYFCSIKSKDLYLYYFIFSNLSFAVVLFLLLYKYDKPL